MIKTILAIPTFNRPEYVEKCFASLKQANLDGVMICLIDDCSTDKRTIQLFESFFIEGVPILKYRNKKNVGVTGSLLNAIELTAHIEYEYFINLDSDAIVKPDFIQKLIVTKAKNPLHFVTGFNSRTRNRDGSERHFVVHEEQDFCLKKSVGGINMTFCKSEVFEHLEPILQKCSKNGGNWDHEISIKYFDNGFPPVCVKPSVVQHIGTRSSMNHNHDKPDIAEDFDEVRKTRLAGVGLFILDTINADGLIHAVKQSTKAFEFESIVVMHGENEREKIMSELGHLSKLETHIAYNVNSKEDYSRFMIEDLAICFPNHSHVLVIQSDGFIVNAEAWTDEFLKYDYIGAKWWFEDAFNVGNGGFSLRSTKLCQHIATSGTIAIKHPEDEVICRTYGKELKKAGFKFAPESIADKFSFEAYGKRSNEFKGSLGFHGYGINFGKYAEINKIVPKRAPIIKKAGARSHGYAIIPDHYKRK